MRVADSSSAAAVAERAQPTTGMPEAANASTHAAVAYVFPDPGRPAPGCSASAPGRHTARTMAICSVASSGPAALAESTPSNAAVALGRAQGRERVGQFMEYCVCDL